MSVDLYNLDLKNRTAALNTNQSFIVEAPAGSGKTELLIQRYLSLLSTVSKPEEILAITFTKKAASEMRLRIIKALQEATQEEPALPHKKITYQLAKQVLDCDARYNWGIRNNPNQLRIQTIDALCTYLTKQLPLLSQFGAAPKINSNPVLLYQKAVQEVLSHVEANYEWSQAVGILLSHLDNDINKLEQLLIHLLSKRDQWLPYIPLTNNLENLRHKLEANIQSVCNSLLQLFNRTISSTMLSQMIELAHYAAFNISDETSKLFQWRYLNKPPKDCNKLDAYVALAQLFLTKDLELRKRVDTKLGFPSLSNFKQVDEKNHHKKFRQKFSDLIEKLLEQKDIHKLLAEILLLPPHKYTEQQWQILSSLLVILKITLAQLRITFQQEGQVDFIENAQAALQALGSDENPTDLALALDYQIKHILIDEFQDTSHTQFHLLQKLIAGWQVNDGRTLFVVGDPMQSIYRFREAEVGLFIRMMSLGINDLPLNILTLSTNFRSTPVIVEWNNTTFSKIFPALSEIGTGAVCYKKSTALTLEGDQPSFVSIRGFESTDETNQAEYIVSLIHKLLQDNPVDTIAILVRSRSHLAALLPSLKKAKIDYQAMEIDALSSQQCIQDLLALTCALLHPADRIAWLSVLRAPWCGLTLKDLFIIANLAPHLTIIEQLTQIEKLFLSEDGLLRIKRVLPVLQHQLANRYRFDVRSWIETTWLKLAGPATLLTEEAKENIKVYFSLLESFTVSDLHLNLGFLKEQVDLLFAQPKNSPDIRLHIMTIHSAKGLEFDHVIIPHLEKKNPYDSKSLLNWLECPLDNGQTALLLTGIPDLENTDDNLYHYIQRQQQIKLDYETDRLFYVATTRAKKSLHLTFNISCKENGEYKVDSGSFLGKIWPLIRDNIKDIIAKPLIELEVSENTTQTKRLLRLPSDWHSPLSLQLDALAGSHQSYGGFLLSNPKSAIIGTVIHKILQHLASKSTAWWLSQNQNQQLNFLKKLFMQKGLDKIFFNEASDFVLRVIKKVLNDPRGQWLLQAHELHQAEYGLTAIIDNQIKNLIIDRTFIDKGIRWIIDYKTTLFTEGDLEEFLSKAYQQHATQMALYAQAFQLMEDKPIKIGLYFPAIPAWHENNINITINNPDLVNTASG